MPVCLLQPVDVFAAYEGEPAVPERRQKKVAAKTAEQKETEAAPVAFQFNIPNDAVNEQTNNQIKARVQQAFFGWGTIDEIRVLSSEENKEVTVFIARALGKSATAKEAIEKGTGYKVSVYDQELDLSVYEGVGSGGGKVSQKPQKPKEERTGGRGGRGM